LRVVAFGKVCDTISNYFAKGTGVIIEGRIRTNTYEAKDGTKKYSTDIILDHFEFLPRAKDSARAPEAKADPEPFDEQALIPPGGSSEDDIPF